MNKKQLIIAALATVMSVSAANASNITGIDGIPNAGGTGNIFNINPETVSGDVGYRHYNDFNLTAGDIANLIFRGDKNGTIRDINSFINLVQNKIDINGVVNTMRDNNFYNGHAIFISPNGMTVGASGVLNVGQLSVITPTQDNFDKLKNAYDSRDYATMNKVSEQRNSAAVNYGGNAPVTINGVVLSRNGVDVRGSMIDIGSTGRIINGINNSEVISSATRANELFNTLVNTTGLNNGGVMLIKSGTGADAGIKIAGKVANLSTGTTTIKNQSGTVSYQQTAETGIVNNGAQGLTISGDVTANNQLTVNNKAGNLLVNGTAKIANKNADLAISNKGAGMEIAGTAKISTTENLGLVNQGTGDLHLGTGTKYSAKRIDAVNKNTTGNFTVDQNAELAAVDTVRIVNRGGQLAFAGKAKADSVSVRNEGTSMNITGDLNATSGLLVNNRKGTARIGGNLTVAEGDLAIYNESTADRLIVLDTANITGSEKIAVKNESAGGMGFSGNINNTEDSMYTEIAINNTAGDLTFNGNINNTGNVGIINKENGGYMLVAGNITNEGKFNIKNYSGSEMNLNGTVNNTGDMNVYNDAGQLNINKDITVADGNLNIGSRVGSTGLSSGANSKITNTNGNIAIVNKGTNGMSLNGEIEAANGVVSVNNHLGDMSVKGTITANDNVGIINRAGGSNMTVDATVKANGAHTVNIKNFGTGDMTVNGDITHEGRLNVLANEGLLNMDGKIQNNGTDMTYAASRLQQHNPTPGSTGGKGIVVGENFAADSTGGTILIKNITGDQGLTYQGSMTNTNGQAEIYNMVGDMNVTGGSIDANTAIILNKGNNLTVTDAVTLTGENKVKIVNKGSEKADVADKFKENGEFREQLKK